MSHFGQSFFDRFKVLTGHPPLVWQERLFRDLVAGRIPNALDLPTGLGKTSVMAVWYLARQAGASLPRRLVYVVDRRAVVDQATTIADEIKKRSDDNALRVSTLRGQHVDNREWLNDPAAPAIIVGTVDMIGSRLLFEGYGVSRRMRPYHAGILGADTLVVLDEAHLVPPFEKLLEAIESEGDVFGARTNEDRTIIPQFRLLSLSATGREREGSIFRLDEADLGDQIVKKRLHAKKSVTTISVESGQLVDALANQAWALADGGTAPVRCIVYCDSRDVAEKTMAAIDALVKGDKKKEVAKVEVDSELFVGARRVLERDLAAKRLKALGFLAGSERPSKSAFLIATSAGEVGVDLDADHMVCDLVPWERMVQRLGRVNRLGDGDAKIVVIDNGEPRLRKPGEPTPKETRDLIGYRALSVLKDLPRSADGFDASPAALRDLRLRAGGTQELKEKIEAATTPVPLRPALTRALVDAWSMTSLEQHTGRPEISPWLRGWIEEDQPQTSVVWRTHLPVRKAGGAASSEDVESFFEAAPPHASEVLETETYRVVEWLMMRASAAREAARPRTEPEHEEAGEQGSEQVESRSSKPLAADDIIAFALTPTRKLHKTYCLRDFTGDMEGKKSNKQLEGDLIGATLVVDARLGGLGDGLLDAKKSEAPRTADSDDVWSQIAEFRVRRTGTRATAPDAKDWRFEDDFVRARNDDGEDVEWLIVERLRSSKNGEEGRSISRPQSLAEHQSWTECKAKAIAASIGLHGVHADALAIAARLHDEGKRADRWQKAFNAQKADAAILRPLAKTRGPFSKQVLDHYRHEFGSLPYAEKDEGFLKLSQEFQDLVLHLIAAHHGQARPIIDIRGCEDGPPSALEERARDVALRFARLQKRWGPWGLAWWEALLRAADQQASKENDARESAPDREDA